MKKILLAVFVFSVMLSCKKDNDDVTCEVSVAGVTGSYKLTKVVVTFPGLADQDITTSFTTDCQRNGVYQLNSNKSVVYTETGTCTDSGTGTWDIVNGKLTMSSNGGSYDVNDLTVSGWDCTTLTVSMDNGSGSYTNISFTKQ